MDDKIIIGIVIVLSILNASSAAPATKSSVNKIASSGSGVPINGPHSKNPFNTRVVSRYRNQIFGPEQYYGAAGLPHQIQGASYPSPSPYYQGPNFDYPYNDGEDSSEDLEDEDENNYYWPNGFGYAGSNYLHQPIPIFHPNFVPHQSWGNNYPTQTAIYGSPGYHSTPRNYSTFPGIVNQGNPRGLPLWNGPKGAMIYRNPGYFRSPKVMKNQETPPMETMENFEFIPNSVNSQNLANFRTLNPQNVDSIPDIGNNMIFMPDWKSPGLSRARTVPYNLNDGNPFISGIGTTSFPLTTAGFTHNGQELPEAHFPRYPQAGEPMPREWNYNMEGNNAQNNKMNLVGINSDEPNPLDSEYLLTNLRNIYLLIENYYRQFQNQLMTVYEIVLQNSLGHSNPPHEIIVNPNSQQFPTTASNQLHEIRPNSENPKLINSGEMKLDNQGNSIKTPGNIAAPKATATTVQSPVPSSGISSKVSLPAVRTQIGNSKITTPDSTTETGGNAALTEFSESGAPNLIIGTTAPRTGSSQIVKLNESNANIPVPLRTTNSSIPQIINGGQTGQSGFSSGTPKNGLTTSKSFHLSKGQSTTDNNSNSGVQTTSNQPNVLSPISKNPNPTTTSPLLYQWTAYPNGQNMKLPTSVQQPIMATNSRQPMYYYA